MIALDPLAPDARRVPALDLSSNATPAAPYPPALQALRTAEARRAHTIGLCTMAAQMPSAIDVSVVAIRALSQAHPQRTAASRAA